MNFYGYILFAIISMATLISLAFTGITPTTNVLFGLELALAIRLILGEVVAIRSYASE